MHAVWIFLNMVLLQSLSEMVFPGWSSAVCNIDNMVVLNPVSSNIEILIVVTVCFAFPYIAFWTKLSHKSVKAYGTILIGITGSDSLAWLG